MSLSSIAQHARNHGIVPLKRYGQNFIFDKSLCEKIVRTSNIAGDAHILEIGPGIGGLSRAILDQKPQSLTVIEVDGRCITLLSELQAQYQNLHIIKEDALRFRLSDIFSHKVNIISNLPYNIGTELLVRWLKEVHLIKNMTLMLQKEVVQRICADVGTKAYGRLSIICQIICEVKKCFDVSAQAFYPAPKVQSSVVQLTPLRLPPTLAIINKVEVITRMAFSERRKMIKSSLQHLSPQIAELLLRLDIDCTKRAENLSPQDYLALAHIAKPVKLACRRME